MSGVRLTGELVTSRRGMVLKMDDGDAFALGFEVPVEHLICRRVTVEGNRSGLDWIAVDWIGETDPQ